MNSNSYNTSVHSINIIFPFLISSCLFLISCSTGLTMSQRFIPRIPAGHSPTHSPPLVRLLSATPGHGSLAWAGACLALARQVWPQGLRGHAKCNMGFSQQRCAEIGAAGAGAPSTGAERRRERESEWEGETDWSKEKRGENEREAVREDLVAETWCTQASLQGETEKCILGLNTGSCWRVWAGCGSEVMVWVRGGVADRGKGGGFLGPSVFWSCSQREGLYIKNCVCIMLLEIKTV